MLEFKDMKNYIVLFLILLSTQSFAIKSRKIVPSVGSPLPTEYSYSNSQSRALSELTGVYDHLLINNGQAVQIACTVDNPTLGVAQTAETMRDREIVIPANQGYIMDDIRTATDIYCRSDSGSARTSSEPILLLLW